MCIHIHLYTDYCVSLPVLKIRSSHSYSQYQCKTTAFMLAFSFPIFISPFSDKGKCYSLSPHYIYLFICSSSLYATNILNMQVASLAPAMLSVSTQMAHSSASTKEEQRRKGPFRLFFLFFLF